MSVAKVLAKFRRSKGWFCCHPDCDHSTEFITVAIGHQHMVHEIPTRLILKDRGNLVTPNPMSEAQDNLRSL